MNYDLAIIGFGVIGVETLHNIVLKTKKNSKIKIAVIEKEIINIPGGIAYSKTKAKFGYFNNPLRLSHPSFISWIKKRKNLQNFILFIKKNSSFNLSNWLKNNYTNIINKKFNEIYFPRIVYSFYLEDKIIKILKIIKEKNLKIIFFKGEVKKINFKKKYLLLSSISNFNLFRILYKKNNINIIKSKKTQKIIKTNKMIIGTGLLPPEKINFKDRNYIWNFYAEGGTNNLLKKINHIGKKKNIVLTFIGNKAGFLETTLELKRLVKYKKFKIFINIISKNSNTLNKAKFSKNSKNFNLIFLNNKKINKVTKADEILNLIKKEIKYALSNKFNTYDVWTSILKKNILSKLINKLNDSEKKKYNSSIFPLIRNMTRFTYPEPIIAKQYLSKTGIIKEFYGKAIRIKKSGKKINVITDKKEVIKSDIVINVSGPVNLNNLSKESPFVKSIIKKINKIDKRGFITNKDFMLTEQIFIPGLLSYNFNPSRQTIIKAITNNSKKIANIFTKNICHK